MYGLNDDATSRQIQELWKQILGLKEQVRQLQRSREPRPVEDFALTDAEGQSVRLSQLFGDKRHMILVHNMGFACSYCTMWADGFNGLRPHLEERFAFYIVSPDTPEQQAKGAAARGWQLRMLSSRGSDFTKALGFEAEHEGKTHWLPGASAFVKGEDGQPRLMGQTPFGPGDDFNAVFAFQDLLPAVDDQ